MYALLLVFACFESVFASDGDRNHDYTSRLPFGPFAPMMSLPTMKTQKVQIPTRRSVPRLHERDTNLPLCHGCPGAVRLVELPDLYAMVEGASCEADTIEIVRGVSYEITVRVLYQASLH